METDRSLRTVFAVTLIVAALMVATNYALNRAPLRSWWLPAALIIAGVALALPIKVVQPRRSEHADEESHPTHAEIEAQIRYAPTPGEAIYDTPAGTDTPSVAFMNKADQIGSDPGAPVVVTHTETGHTHEIPTLGVDEESPTDTPPTAESADPAGKIPDEKQGIRDPQQFDSPGKPRQTTADEGTTTDLSGTKQAVTPDQPAPTAEPPITADPTADISKESADTSAAIAPNSGAMIVTDDLVKLDGIGPRIAGVLIEAGIDTYAKLAGTTEERLREILTSAGIRLVPSIGTWSEQAAIASKGDWAELKRLIAERKASRGGD